LQHRRAQFVLQETKLSYNILLFQKRSKSTGFASHTNSISLVGFFFSRKEAKALVLPHKKNSISPLIFFSRLVVLHQQYTALKLGEADPGGLGACPQEKQGHILFQKTSKSGIVGMPHIVVACLCRKSAKPTQGFARNQSFDQRIGLAGTNEASKKPGIDETR
jgi:hypothetical protein